MIYEITLLLATPITISILDKFYEGIASKFGEKIVELLSKLPEKTIQLGQLIWGECLNKRSETINLLENAANGSVEDQKKLTEYLHGELELNSSLKHETQKLAEEIYQIIKSDDLNARNIQNNVGSGQNLQVNDPKSQVIQTGDNARLYFGVPPEG